MKFYAVTQCPLCGWKQVEKLNGPSFLKKETTRCNKCGQMYSTVFNCLLKTSKKEEALREVESQRLISKFSTEELEKELAARHSVSV